MSPAPATSSLTGLLFLTIGYFFVELAGGIVFNSLALLTDAAFMAVNVVGQLIALYTVGVSSRPADRRFTFGHERAKVISGLVNGVLTGFVLFYVFQEAYHKIVRPEPVDAALVLVVALLGLLVNGYGLLRLRRATARDINIRGAYLHVLTDALGSIGVVISSVVIHFTGWYIADPVMGVLIGLLAAFPMVSLIRASLDILMEGNPSGVGPEEVRAFILDNHPFVLRVKKLHIWGLSPERLIMVGRIRTDGILLHREEVKDLKRALKQRFGLHDIFLEVYEDGPKYRLRAAADNEARP